MTYVRPSRQKLIGLKLQTGKPATDDSAIGDLKLKKGQKFMMLGSPENVIHVAGSAADVTDIVDDLQMQDEVFETLQPHKDPDVLVRPSNILSRLLYVFGCLTREFCDTRVQQVL